MYTLTKHRYPSSNNRGSDQKNSNCSLLLPPTLIWREPKTILLFKIIRGFFGELVLI